MNGLPPTSSEALTHVPPTWIEGVIEQWIMFDRVASERIVDRRRRVLSFAPGAPFALVHWRANAIGTIVSRIAIVTPVEPGAPFTTVPGTDPGGDLLHIAGWPKVERVLEAIDCVEAIGVDPPDAAPEYWRHGHNRLAARLPRPCVRDRRRARLQRRDLQT
jgi:hypothetical protein